MHYDGESCKAVLYWLAVRTWQLILRRTLFSQDASAKSSFRATQTSRAHPTKRQVTVELWRNPSQVPADLLRCLMFWLDHVKMPWSEAQSKFHGLW